MPAVRWHLCRTSELPYITPSECWNEWPVSEDTEISWEQIDRAARAYHVEFPSSSGASGGPGATRLRTDAIVLIDQDDPARDLAAAWATLQQRSFHTVSGLANVRTVAEQAASVTVVSSRPNEHAMLGVQKALHPRAVGFLVGRSLSAVAFLMAKTLAHACDADQWIYVPMVDSSPDTVGGNVATWTRTSSQIPKLVAPHQPVCDHLVMVAHGTGTRLFLGPHELTAQSAGFSLPADALQFRHVFLDTCFGVSRTPDPDDEALRPLWAGILQGVPQSLIAYVGHKSNSVAEGHWYYGLVERGYSLGEAVQQINRQMEETGMDAGHYVLLGDPEHRCSVPVDDEASRTTGDRWTLSPAQKHAVIAMETEGDEFVSANGHGEWLPTRQGYLLATLKGTLPTTGHLVPSLPVVPHVEDLAKLERLHVVPQRVAGLVREWSGLQWHAAKLQRRARHEVKAMHRLIHTVTQIETIRHRIRTEVLHHTVEVLAKVRYPLTEIYDQTFVLAERPSPQICPGCAAPATLKRLVHTVFSEWGREVTTCPACGVVQDVPIGARMAAAIQPGNSPRTAHVVVQTTAPGATEAMVIPVVSRAAIVTLSGDGQACLPWLDDTGPALKLVGLVDNDIHYFARDLDNLDTVGTAGYTSWQEGVAQR